MSQKGDCVETSCTGAEVLRITNWALHACRMVVASQYRSWYCECWPSSAPSKQNLHDQAWFQHITPDAWIDLCCQAKQQKSDKWCTEAIFKQRKNNRDTNREFSLPAWLPNYVKRNSGDKSPRLSERITWRQDKFPDEKSGERSCCTQKLKVTVFDPKRFMFRHFCQKFCWSVLCVWPLPLRTERSSDWLCISVLCPGLQSLQELQRPTD